MYPIQNVNAKLNAAWNGSKKEKGKRKKEEGRRKKENASMTFQYNTSNPDFRYQLNRNAS